MDFIALFILKKWSTFWLIFVSSQSWFVTPSPGGYVEVIKDVSPSTKKGSLP
jgi:hypothetical protein